MIEIQKTKTKTNHITIFNQINNNKSNISNIIMNTKITTKINTKITKMNPIRIIIFEIE